MLETLRNHVLRAAKAYVAVATPIVTKAIADLVTEFNTAATGLIAVLVGAVVVYLVPNQDV